MRLRMYMRPTAPAQQGTRSTAAGMNMGSAMDLMAIGTHRNKSLHA